VTGKQTRHMTKGTEEVMLIMHLILHLLHFQISEMLFKGCKLLRHIQYAVDTFRAVRNLIY